MKSINFSKYAIQLSYGAHCSPREGMCIMECVAYIAGEKHTDKPDCASEPLTALAIKLNDHAPSHAVRQRLLPLVLRLAASKGTPDQEAERGNLVFFHQKAWDEVEAQMAEALCWKKSVKLVEKTQVNYTAKQRLGLPRWEAEFALLSALLPPLPEVTEADLAEAKTVWADRKLKELEKITRSALKTPKMEGFV
jgi:hypothetical protein